MARGGTRGQIGDLALWAVPAGLIGARLWHVATDHQLYFGEGRDPVDALKIWQGGLGIWGAIMGGLVGAWFYCRRHGILVRPLADALAPSLLLAQIIGRFGNYFNQELFGRPTDLPWGLEIDAAHRPSGYEQFDDVPSHVPLRGAVEPGRDRGAALGRPAVPARLRPGVRALRDALHPGSWLDRVPADRPRGAGGRRWPAVQRVDLDRAVRGGHGVLRGRHPAPPPSGQPRAHAVPSRPRQRETPRDDAGNGSEDRPEDASVRPEDTESGRSFRPGPEWAGRINPASEVFVS